VFPAIRRSAVIRIPTRSVRRSGWLGGAPRLSRLWVRQRRLLTGAVAAVATVALAALVSAPEASAFGGVLATGISSAPAAIDDRATGNLEVYWDDYARLMEDSFVASSQTWTGPKALASGISGSPAVFNDPYTGNLEVYYDNSNVLTEDALIPGRGWTGAMELATGISGTPSLAPFSGQVHVVYNDHGQLTQDTFVPGWGWTGAQKVGSSIIGSPSAIGDIFTRNFEIYYNDGGNLTEDAYVTNSRTWTGPKVLGDGITGRPSVTGFALAAQLQIHYNHNGQLYQDTFVPGHGFVGPQAVGTSIVGSPAANSTYYPGLSGPVTTPPSGCMTIYYEDTDPSRGNVTDLAEDGYCVNPPSPGFWTGAFDLTTDVTGLTGSAVPIALGPSGPINDTSSGTFFDGEKVFFQMGNNLVWKFSATTF
jgi:hypothetical protein